MNPIKKLAKFEQISSAIIGNCFQQFQETKKSEILGTGSDW